MRVAILGRTQILYDTIDLIAKSGHEIVLIGTCKAEKEYTRKETDFEKKAQQYGVPFFNSSKINSQEIIELMKSTHADVAISVNWKVVIGCDAMGAFPYGVLNAHCGDLPRYRGNACPNWAILNQEKEYGITVHYMKPDKLDAGDIIVKKKYPILPDTDITDIYQNMDREIPILFVEALNTMETRKAEVQSKNSKDILRCYPRIPGDSFIDWNQSCDEILRIIRASASPFDGAYTYFEGQKIHIMKASKRKFETPCLVIPGQVIIVDKLEGTVGIATKDGVIYIEHVITDGKKYPVTEVLSSTRIRLNYQEQDEIYQLKKRIERLEEIMSLIQEEKKND